MDMTIACGCGKEFSICEQDYDIPEIYHDDDDVSVLIYAFTIECPRCGRKYRCEERYKHFETEVKDE
jgi:adenine-specific DNA methylase